MPVRRGKSRRKMERFFESCFASFSSKFSSHLLAFSTHLPTTCSLRQLVHFRVNSSPFTAASSSMQLSLLALSLHPGYLAVLLPPPSPVYRFIMSPQMITVRPTWCPLPISVLQERVEGGLSVLRQCPRSLRGEGVVCLGPAAPSSSPLSVHPRRATGPLPYI